MKDKKIIRKLLFAILLVGVLTFVSPVIFQIYETGYTAEAASVRMNKTKLTLDKGAKYTLKLIGGKKVKWSTSNKKIATVNSKGKVTAKAKGNVTITAKYGKKKYRCKIKVETPSISKTSVKIFKGSTYTLKMKGTSRSIKWSTSNKYVATVDSKGRVKGVENGTVTITATVGSKKYRCKVYVQGYEKNIVTSYKKLTKSSILIMLTNKNNCKIDFINATVKFYKNGTLVSSREIIGSCLGAGRTVYNKVYAPYNSNTNTYMEYDSVKITVDRANCYATMNRTDMYNNVYVETSKSQDLLYGVIGTVKNKGYREIKSIDLGVIYYKNGEIIGYSTDYVTNLYAGNEKVIKFTKPLEDNLDEREFDSYKVVINHAYTY